MGISVIVYLPTGEIKSDTITFSELGPKLEKCDSYQIREKSEEIYFGFNEKLPNNYAINSDLRIQLAAIVMTKKYDDTKRVQYETYPLSTDGWITHLSDTGQEAVFILQNIHGSKKKLLTILERSSSKILEMHVVQSYEANILTMSTDWNRYNEIKSSVSDFLEKKAITSLLEGPPPSWADLAQLVDGVNVPNLERKDNMKHTIEQLVPNSFPKKVREELTAFLAWVPYAEIPKSDPLDFLDDIRMKFSNAPLLKSLVVGHIQCLIQNKKPPQYVRIMAMADKGNLASGKEPLIETAGIDPWSQTWYKFMEMFPVSKNNVVDIAGNLNQNRRILTELPISREDAKKSRELWSDRFSLVHNTLVLRGYIQEPRIGLSKLVYIGGAHRWPHKHLMWTARLGNQPEKPPYIQVLVVPKSIALSITRLKGNISHVNWSAQKINCQLFDQKKSRWRANISRIADSLSNTKSLSQLKKEFSIGTSDNIYMPNASDVRILDFVSWGMDIHTLELNRYDEYLGIDRFELRRKLELLRDQGILDLQYYLYMSGLVSVCIEIIGQSDRINSVARAALKHFPSSTVLITDDNETCFVIARVPEYQAYDVLVNFPSLAEQNNMSIRAFRISSYAGYVHNLYQRLLRKDQTWDDDISDFIGQMNL